MKRLTPQKRRPSSRRLSSISNSTQAFSYENLEPKNLLAGIVFVDLVGPNLSIWGDAKNNAISVDLNATDSQGLVQALDDSRIVFSDDFADGVDLSGLRDVRVFTGRGDDSVTINGKGFVAQDDLIVSLGAGNDSLYVAGSSDQRFEVDDVWLYGMSGHDSIFLSHVDIADDTTTFAAAGQDVVVFNQVNVGDMARIWGQVGHDSILINESTFGDDVRIEGGPGADRFESMSSDFQDRLFVKGRQGWDTVMENVSNQFDSSPIHQSIEREDSIPNTAGRTQLVVDQLKANFFEMADSLELPTGDLVQDGLAELAASYDTNLITLELDAAIQTVAVTDPTPTISVQWDQAVQQAVANEAPGPTIGSRAYAMMHTAMYDAWSAYDLTARSTQLGDDLQRPVSENTEANKTAAMSFAAYRVLDDLFSDQTAIFDDVMDELGLDPSNASTDVTTAAGIGNRMAAALLEFRHSDGSNQLGTDSNGTNGVAYSDTTNYQPVNGVGDASILDAWTPEFVPIDSGDAAIRTQQFLTPQWGDVTAFGSSSSDEFLPDAPQPFLLVDGDVDLVAKTITLSDGTILDIDKSLIGTVINPEFISQAEEVVDFSAALNDEQKLVAEFWEDGGGTSFPPGTFMTFGEFVSARDNHSIDDDAKMFFALGNAVFDAGIATWNAKVHYDYVRPVRAIRELGELGLIGEFNASLGGYAIDAWTPDGGTQTILATDFLTYQTPGSDPSPPFAEYTSGHSAFSAAGAAILEMFTGSDEFGGSVTFEAGESRFEPLVTPAEAVTLSWDTFSAAADEAGLSRLYGGIHFVEGDINGRTLGVEVGASVWDQAQFFINGGVV